jgi:hypothetical protein
MTRPGIKEFWQINSEIFAKKQLHTFGKKKGFWSISTNYGTIKNPNCSQN